MRNLICCIITVISFLQNQSNIIAQPSKQSFEKINIDGATRTYILYLPTDYSAVKNNSLVIALHGKGGTGLGMERLSGFESIAEKEKFIVVYPNGIDRSWNDGRNTKAHEAGINDVAFIKNLIDEIIIKYNVDKHKVYVAGMSNGAFMSMKLACELSGKITAIAAVAGTMDTASASICRPALPLSVILIQGTSDPLVPFEGGELKSKAAGIILSHKEAIKHWVKINNCTSSPVSISLPDAANDGTTITKTTYKNESNNTEVISIIVANGGHTWPGGYAYLPERWIGITSRNMNASEEIWNFFKKH